MSPQLTVVLLLSGVVRGASPRGEARGGEMCEVPTARGGSGEPRPRRSGPRISLYRAQPSLAEIAASVRGRAPLNTYDYDY